MYIIYNILYIIYYILYIIYYILYVIYYMLYIRDIIRIHNSSKYDTWMRLEMELYTNIVAFEANMLMHQWISVCLICGKTEVVQVVFFGLLWTYIVSGGSSGFWIRRGSPLARITFHTLQYSNVSCRKIQHLPMILPLKRPFVRKPFDYQLPEGIFFGRDVYRCRHSGWWGNGSDSWRDGSHELINDLPSGYLT